MCSGKSTELCHRLGVHHEFGSKVLFVGPTIDTRGTRSLGTGSADEKTGPTTHNPILGTLPYKTVRLDSLRNLNVDYSDYDVFGIDEAQFFPDLVESVRKLTDDLGKTVIVAGLNGDSNRKNFGRIHELLGMMNDFTLLSAFCERCKQLKGCKTPAHFTKRLVRSSAIVMVGGKDLYSAMCRECFLASDRTSDRTSERE